MDGVTPQNKMLGTLGKLKVLLKDSLLFGGLNAFTKFFSLFLTPFLTRALDKSEYGNVDILMPLLGIAATIVVCGMDSAVGRFYYYNEDRQYRKSVISNAFWLQFFLATFVSALMFYYSPEILVLYLGETYQKGQELYLRIISLIVFLMTPLKFAQNLLIWCYRRKEYFFLSVGYVTVNFFSVVLCVLFIEDKIQGFFIGQVIPAFFFGIVAIYLIRKDLVWTIDRLILKKMLHYGIPLIMVALVPALIPSLDRYFVNKYLGLTEVATYGLGFRIATLVALPITSLNTALGPFIYAQYKEKHADKFFDVLLNLIIITVSVSIMVVALLSPILISFFATKEYLGALIVVVPLCFYFLVDMLRTLGAVGIDLSLKTYWNLFLYPVSLILLYGLLFSLTKYFGILGTSLALALSSIINFVLFSYTGMKLYNFSFNLGKKLLMLFFCFGVALLVPYFITHHGYTFALLVPLVFLTLSFFLFFSRENRDKIWDVAKSKLLKRNEG